MRQAQHRAARASIAMRQHVGSRGNMFISAIISGKAMPPATVEQIDRFSGSIQQDCDLMNEGYRRLGKPAGLTEAFDTIQAKFFVASVPIYDSVIAAGRNGTPYPFEVAEYRKRHVPGMNSTLLVRDAAMAAAGDAVTAAQTAAFHQLLIALGAMALVVACVARVTVVFTRRVVSPLAELTTVITRIARSDIEIAVPAGDRSDEIGQMAQAIETLRQNAVEARRLAADSVTEQAARLERSGRIETLTNRFDQEATQIIKELHHAASSMQAQADQTAQATKEIAPNVQRAADSTRVVTSEMDAVNSVMRASGQSAKEMQSAVVAVSARAETRTGQIARFLAEVRAA